MDPTAIQAIVGAVPGGGIAALAIWFAILKDRQCTAQMDKMSALVASQVAAAVDLKAALESVRDAIRAGTRS